MNKEYTKIDFEIATAQLAKNTRKAVLFSAFGNFTTTVLPGLEIISLGVSGRLTPEEVFTDAKALLYVADYIEDMTNDLHERVEANRKSVIEETRNRVVSQNEKALVSTSDEEIELKLVSVEKTYLEADEEFLASIFNIREIYRQSLFSFIGKNKAAFDAAMAKTDD